MKKRLYLIIVSAILLVIALLIPEDLFWLQLSLYIISYIVIGYKIVFKAFKNIIRGKVFDENFLMTIATIGAFAIREFPEAVAVMLFYQVGELFQSYAVNKSRKSISDLMNIRPDYANLVIDDKIIQTDPESVKIGDIISIAPGEKVPLDGVIIEGVTSLDMSALTGESVPQTLRVGDEILSGAINLHGLVKVRVEKEFSESTVSKILNLVENASNKKAKSENFITKFAKYYTPIVVVCAALLAVLPPLIDHSQSFSDWIYRALSFLVVSCPCALVISIPLSFFGGIGGASRNGILVKGSNYLESLAKTKIVVFDKTGTLTLGVFKVQEINNQGISKEDMLYYVAHTESFSSHPIAKSLLEAYGKEIDQSVISNVEEISGKGIKAEVNNHQVLVGNESLLNEFNIDYVYHSVPGTVTLVAVDGKYSGYILIADKIKDDAYQAITALKNIGVTKTIMLTGDNREVALKIADQLGIDEVHAKLLPADKVDKLEEIIAKKSSNELLAYAGDGINDAPVLARADIGIAMGGVGSDAAIEAADVVIMTDEPSKIVTAINISKKTLKIVVENIVFAIAIKVLVLVLVALGFATMWQAVFADVGVCVLAILNAFRALSIKQNKGGRKNA